MASIAERAKPVRWPTTRFCRPEEAAFRFEFVVHDVSRMRQNLFDLQMKPLGITRSQWSVLSALSNRSQIGVRQVDLARELEVGKGTLGGLLDRLENLRFVQRAPDPRDRRVRLVFITPIGRKLVGKMQSVGEEHNGLVLQSVSSEDLRITERTLATIKANIRTALNVHSAGAVTEASE